MNDFLLTVLSTASNLESLIESKPTERGNILSRFIGLEILKDKESMCKKMYSEWSKKLISNVYNVEELKEEIKNNNTQKENLTQINVTHNSNLELYNTELKSKNNLRDTLISQKITDIDTEIQNVNPRLVLDEEKILESLKLKVKAYGDKQIPEDIDLEYFGKKTKNRDEIQLEKVQNITNLKNLNKTLQNLVESEVCPTCKQNLKDVDHTEEIKELKNEINTLSKLIEVNKQKLENLNKELEVLNTKKIIFDEYEKEMLKKERLVLEVGQKELEVEKLKNKLIKWKQNKERLENNSRIEKEILTLDSNIDVLKNKKETTFKEIEYNTNQILNCESVVKDCTTKIGKIKKENEVDKVFRAYLTIFGKNGIIKTIVKSVVPKLNNELMRLLTDVTKFMVEIRVSDKNEVEFWMVDNDSRVEKLLVTGSGFEKTLASLAIRTVLTKVSCLPRPNVTVFDEVLGKVSNDNLDEVGVFFSRLKDYFENVFLITHNPLVREWADNNLTIEKENNISKVK